MDVPATHSFPIPFDETEPAADVVLAALA